MMAKMSGQQWMVLLLLGLLLTVIALPVKKDSESRGAEMQNTETSWKTEGTVSESELERKLASILQNTEGVGRVQVLLMTGGEQKGFYDTDTEAVTGILIAAEGADDPVTKRNIQQAVMALFQIEAHKIKIMKMK
ncbi:MAG: hypothetical protein ACLRPF_05725 [Blautia sp.]